MRTCWTNVDSSGVWRVIVDGPKLDADGIDELRKTVQTVLSSGGRDIVIDLQRIDRLDPLGLSGLALLPIECPTDVHIVLASLQPNVQEAALLVHLHDVLDIYEDARAAAFDLSKPIASS